DEDFAAAAGNRSQAGFAEIRDNSLQRLVENFTEMDEFAGAEPVDVYLGKFVFDVREQIQVPLLGQFGVMAALHQDLRPVQRHRFLDLFVQLLERDDVGIVVLFRSVKSAKF